MKSSQSGIPGFEYLERVAMAWQRAMTDQARIANTAWEQMLTGEFDQGAMAKNMAKLAEAFFPAVTEGFRGPGYVREPVWVYFTYTQPPEDNTLETVVRIPRMEAQATELDPTTFASMHGQLPLDGVYTTCAWADGDSSRTQIKIVLDRTKLSAATGQYISFILPKSRGPEAPLVIVMLRVNP
jgi:hypothetical protein